MLTINTSLLILDHGASSENSLCWQHFKERTQQTLDVFASTLFWTEMFIFSSRKYIIYILFCFCCAVTCICICWDWPRNILCWWELMTFLFYTRNNLIMVIYDSICLIEDQTNKGHEIRPTSFTSPHITFFHTFQMVLIERFGVKQVENIHIIILFIKIV